VDPDAGGHVASSHLKPTLDFVFPPLVAQKFPPVVDSPSLGRPRPLFSPRHSSQNMQGGELAKSGLKLCITCVWIWLIQVALGQKAQLVRNSLLH